MFFGQEACQSFLRWFLSPEIHFFSSTLPINPLFRRLKLHGAGSRYKVKEFLNENGYSSLVPFSGLSTNKIFTYKAWCQKLVEVLDLMTVHHMSKATGNPVWGLEKTPRHLQYISSIEQSESPNKFLHILRQASDVVASLHLATKRYPREWGGARSIKKCIRWWNQSVQVSLKYRNQPNHFFVVYEQLISSPTHVLKAVCNFLDLNYQRSMAEDFHQTAGSLAQKEEEWKTQNSSEALRKSNKLKEHFDASTIKYIETKTRDFNLKQFYR